ncbi:MAG TPA: NUDIX domain-containing protein [Gaiellaceae bacterium]|nr:NUDIX domain-containing protein [Gaiellaceae bacterium]
MERTWDGLPVAPEPPYACCVVVWREVEGSREFLLLHRLAPGGADYEGEWAWTPPSGARQPGEAPDAAAARELAEETGLTSRPTRAPTAGTPDVALYVVEVPPDAEVVLDKEHDRFVWLSIEDALPKCLPPIVASGLANAAASIDTRPAT